MNLLAPARDYDRNQFPFAIHFQTPWISIMSYVTTVSPRMIRQRIGARPLFAALSTMRARALEFWAVCVALEQRRQSRKYLLQMDERLLADIGLNPSQARFEASKPFWK